MSQHSDTDIQKAADTLKKGGIIAYPTEAVYGLGCDPYNVDAISRLLQLKNRPMRKGFILIAASWEQLEPLVQPIPTHALARVLASWPGHRTWIFPMRPEVPHWLYGSHRGLAIRVTDHPSAAKLCAAFGGPIVSTSANLEGEPPIRDQRILKITFGDRVDYVLPGRVGHRMNPSEIRDAISDELIRK